MTLRGKDPVHHLGLNPEADAALAADFKLPGAERLSQELRELRRPANDRQVGGDHYRTPHGRQHWDVVHEFMLDYFQGQITRYLFRWRRKGGIEDLRKARHFLDKYIELAEREEGKEG